jgi:hypothetical protein
VVLEEFGGEGEEGTTAILEMDEEEVVEMVSGRVCVGEYE